MHPPTLIIIIISMMHTEQVSFLGRHFVPENFPTFYFPSFSYHRLLISTRSSSPPPPPWPECGPIVSQINKLTVPRHVTRDELVAADHSKIPDTTRLLSLHQLSLLSDKTQPRNYMFWRIAFYLYDVQPSSICLLSFSPRRGSGAQVGINVRLIWHITPLSPLRSAKLLLPITYFLDKLIEIWGAKWWVPGFSPHRRYTKSIHT